MLTEVSLKRTPIFDEHLALNAKVVPFGGWEMPLQYEGILSEYQNTRQGVTLFDTSHMGEFFIEGDAVKTGFDRIVSQRLTDMPLKTCRYGVIANEQGGVIDDQIVFRLARDRWMIVVNGGTTDKDEQHFKQQLIDKQSFRNDSLRLGKIDVQGPKSRELLNKFIVGIEKLNYYTFDEFEVLGENVLVSRTGYTGELGYEIYYPWDKTAGLWKELLKRGAVPAGLGARDLLRVEMGYCLYGHELAEELSPLDAGLNSFIDWDKNFIGKQALLEQKERGVIYRIACFVSENRRSPRAEHKIFSERGELIGRVTSGTFSTTFQRGVGLGFVRKGTVEKGARVLIGDEKNSFPAEIVSRPIYKEGSLKN